MVLPRAASRCAVSAAKSQPLRPAPGQRVLTGKVMDAEAKLRNILEEYRQVQ
jgi:hypothetical protein